jgi:hypothetical protein
MCCIVIFAIGRYVVVCCYPSYFVSVALANHTIIKKERARKYLTPILSNRLKAAAIVSQRKKDE